MRAIQFSAPGGPEVLEVIELPIPEPGFGEVLVRAHSIGVGKPDVLMRKGVYRWSPPLPAILGNEMSGHIEKIGRGIKNLEVGQPVLVFGTGGGRYAEFNSVSTSLVTPLPNNIDLEDAVSIPNYVIAWSLLFEAFGGKKPEYAYVNGAAGGLGTAIIDLCRSEDISIFAGVSSEKKCKFVTEYGASSAINYSKDEVIPRVIELTEGRGVDVVFDQLVGPNFVNTLDMLAPLGMIISYNALAGLPEKELFSELRARAGKSLAVRCFSWHCYDNDIEKRRKIVQNVVDQFSVRDLKPPIFKRLPLSEARLAHEIIDSREVMGKLVLKP